MFCKNCCNERNHEDRLEDIQKNILDYDTIIKCSDFFKLLSDSTRLQILLVLEQMELCVTDIAGLLNTSISAVSHQLRLLKAGRLVKSRKVGKEVFYDLNDEHVRLLLDVALEHLGEI